MNTFCGWTSVSRTVWASTFCTPGSFVDLPLK